MLKKSALSLISFFSLLLLKAAGRLSQKSLLRLSAQGQESVLIVAPHADDEVLGCGAILKSHHQNGAYITLVNMTDGGGSQSELDQEALKEMRRRELEEVSDQLGIDRIVCLDFPDGRLAVSAESVGRTAEVIYRTRPTVIYVPFFCDFHKDHIAANQILAAALQKTGHRCEIRAYEVQVPITPSLFNAYFEISGSLEEKKSLLKQYRSQTLSLDNAFLYWSINAAFIKNTRFVEVFFVADSADYCTLLNLFVKNREEWVKNFYASGNRAKILLTYLKGRQIRRKIKAEICGSQTTQPFSVLKLFRYPRKV